MNQPNMGATESSLASDSMLASTESIAEQFATENQRDVSRPIADGVNKVPPTNLDIGEPSLREQRRSTKRSVIDPLTKIATEPIVLPDVPSCPYCHAKRFH